MNALQLYQTKTAEPNVKNYNAFYGLKYFKHAWMLSISFRSTFKLSTIMHSSRMRTVRCSGRHVKRPGGTCLAGGGGVCSGGGICPGGCLARGCVCPGECLPRGVCWWESVCVGVSAQGVGVCQTPPTPPPPPVYRITDTCKNITLPQLLCGR